MVKKFIERVRVKKVDRKKGIVVFEISDRLYNEIKKRADAEGMSVEEYAEKKIVWKW